MRHSRTLPLVSALAGLALLLVGTETQATPPSVVVFCERGFPYFAANQAASPRVLAETLRACGLDARLADAHELAAGALRDPSVRCLLWCYGNTFPRETADAIAAYHGTGGCIVATGAPFTHPCVRGESGGVTVWRDEGHQDFGGHDRVGVGQVGGFVKRDGARLAVVEGAPFPLVPMREGDSLQSYPVPAGMGGYFHLGRNGLPAEDELLGMVGVRDARGLRGYLVAAIKHHCERFRGAVDVWSGTQWLSDPRDPAEALLLRQLLLRSVIYVLQESCALPAERAVAAKAAIDKWIGQHRLPSRKPLAFQPRPRSRILPRCPRVDPAETVVVHSVANDPQPVRVALACLQGLVNRVKPRLYLLYTDHDDRWLKWYEERGYVRATEREDDPNRVVGRFRAAMKGAILVDDRFLNVGTMLASVRQGIVCTPELAERWGLPVIADLRGHWARDVDAYRWAFRKLWPRMTHEVLCSGHPQRSAQQTDYLVAHRVFTFFVSGGVDGADLGKDPVEETRFAEDLLTVAAPNAPVLGWWGWGEPAEGIGEYWGMTLASRCAKTTIGTEFMTNMTFHSGIPAPESFRQAQIDRLPSGPLERGNLYIALSVLDSGNDPWYWLRCQRDVWEAPGRGRTPTGWIIGPMLLDLAPGIVEWYYRQLTDRDELICALSGLGYMNVPDYGAAFADRSAVLQEYLSLTREYLRRLDLRTLQTYHGSWGERSDFSRDGDLALYARNLPGLVALFPDIGRHESTTYADSCYSLPGPDGRTRVPVFHCLTRWIPWVFSPDVASRPEEAEIRGLIEEVRRMTPETRPAFMSAFVLSWTFRPEMINRAAETLGEPYVFVTPSQLAHLYSQAHLD